MVYCKLQNYIIDQNSDLEVPNPSHEDDLGHTCGSDRTVHIQDECDLLNHRRRRDLDTSILRQHFINNIHNLALRRSYIMSLHGTTTWRQKTHPRQEYSFCLAIDFLGLRSSLKRKDL